MVVWGFHSQNGQGPAASPAGDQRMWSHKPTAEERWSHIWAGGLLLSPPGPCTSTGLTVLCKHSDAEKGNNKET